MESLRILIVDDDRATATLLQTNFEGEGMVVDSAGDGPEALNIAKRSVPDVFVLDVMMPEMDGLTVRKELRSLPETKDCGVVLLTGRPSSPAKSRPVDWAPTIL